jgi:hypothetical protein
MVERGRAGARFGHTVVRAGGRRYIVGRVTAGGWPSGGDMLVVSMCEGAEVVFAVTAGYGWQVGQLLFIGYFSTTSV